MNWWRNPNYWIGTVMVFVGYAPLGTRVVILGASLMTLAFVSHCHK